MRREPKTTDAVREQFYPVEKSKNRKVFTTDKFPNGSAPSPRISNTQLTFRIEILSSVLDLLHAHRVSPLSLIGLAGSVCSLSGLTHWRSCRPSANPLPQGEECCKAVGQAVPDINDCNSG